MYVLTIFDLGLEQIFGQDVLDRNCSMLCKYSNGQEHHFKSSERNGNYLKEDQSCRLYVSYDTGYFLTAAATLFPSALLKFFFIIHFCMWRKRYFSQLLAI